MARKINITGKVVALIASVITATFVSAVIVKAEPAPPIQDAFEKEMEYPKFGQQETVVAAEGYEDAVSGLKKGSIYLDSINRASGAAHHARNNEIAAAAQRELDYLNSVNPALATAVSSDLEKELAWLAAIDDGAQAAGRARDLQAEDGAGRGLSYLIR